jgi:hypothetical protein
MLLRHFTSQNEKEINLTDDETQIKKVVTLHDKKFSGENNKQYAVFYKNPEKVDPTKFQRCMKTTNYINQAESKVAETIFESIKNYSRALKNGE